MRTFSSRLVRLLTGLQGMTVALLAGGTALAIWLGLLGVTSVMERTPSDGASLLLPGLVGLAFLLSVSGLCWAALLRFLRLCGRLKHERAFTAENAGVLRRIDLSCRAIAALLLLCPFCMSLALGCGLTGFCCLPMVQLWVAAFLFLVIALLFRAIYLLMQRAGALQDEADSIV